MDQRSDLGGADPLDRAETDGNILESETVYQGMTMAAVSEDDTFADEYGGSGTIAGIAADDESVDPDLEEQRQRIERTRAQMGSTIDAIEERLSPSRLAQEAKSAVKDATVGKVQQAASDVTGSASNVGGSVVDTIRANPIPAALAGVGIGWLVMSMRNSGGSRRDAQSYRYYGHNMYPTQHFSENQGAAGGMMSAAQDMAGSVADRAQNTAGQMAGTVQETAGQVAGTVQETASQVTDTVGNAAGTAAGSIAQAGSQAQQGFYRAENQLQRWMREQPLAVAAGTFVAGMAVGLAIPETPIEDQIMGEYRQDLTQQAQQVAQDTAQKVGSVAGQTVSAAKDAAQTAASDAGLPTPGGDGSSA